jgi:hypothetical protein
MLIPAKGPMRKVTDKDFLMVTRFHGMFKLLFGLKQPIFSMFRQHPIATQKVYQPVLHTVVLNSTSIDRGVRYVERIDP